MGDEDQMKLVCELSDSHISYFQPQLTDVKVLGYIAKS